MPTIAPTVGPVENASTPYRIVGSGRTINTVSSHLAIDGDPATVWITLPGVRPRSAYLWFDLGSVARIGSIRWMIGEDGYAGGLQIQVSNDRRAWTTLAVPGNTPAGEWETLPTDVAARYVRFFLTNADRTPALGGIGEVVITP